MGVHDGLLYATALVPGNESKVPGLRASSKCLVAFDVPMCAAESRCGAGRYGSESHHCNTSHRLPAEAAHIVDGTAPTCEGQVQQCQL